MEYPPRNGQGDRRPARPRQDQPSRGERSAPPRRPAAPRTARPQDPPRRRTPPPEKRRRPLRGPKIALVLVSLLVMTLTGYAWASLQGLVNGLTTADVIDPATGDGKMADGARDILLVGLDSRTDAQGNPLSQELLDQLRAGESNGELNTDTLILVHIPNNGGKAVAISLPRDSYVDIPGGYGKHKINSAYARALNDSRTQLQKQGVKDPKEIDQKSNQAGAKSLIATVEKLTGSHIDNYAAVNLLGFSDITKAVGGVDVCLSDNVDDSYSGAKFTKGQHTVSGVEALEFVRQRHGLPRGDLDRVVRQQVFMASMAKKILSAGTLADPSKLSSLIDAIKKSVVLNQGWDILGFAQQLKGLTGGALSFETIPVGNVDLRTPNDGSAVEVDPKAVHDFVQKSAGGTTSTAAAPPPDNHGTTVDVRNSSGKTGLAAGVLQTLTGQGFTAGDTANSASRKASVVRVPTGQKQAGQAVADALGSKATVEEDKTVAAGHVVVFLGADFSPAAGQPSGQAAASTPSPASPPPADQPVITAGGVPCVN